MHKIRTISESTFADDLSKIIRGGRCAVFCGAGISRNSGLPVVSDLIFEFLKSLGLRDREVARLQHAISEDLHIPFEAFVERLIQHSNDDSFLKLFGEALPNTNHRLIAKLAKTRLIRYIITTNFDLLFERAFSLEGMDQKIDFRVLDNEQDFSKIHRPGSMTTTLVKLHGGLGPSKETNTIRTTLQQIARQSLSARRKQIIKTLFTLPEIDSVLFLGYSFSDLFDINPALQSLRLDNKSIIWLDHSTEPIEPVLMEAGLSAPFKKSKAQLIRVRANTNRIVSLLARKFRLSNDHKRPAPPSWRDCTDRWAKKLSGPEKDFLIGLLYEDVFQHRLALKAFLRAYLAARGNANKPLRTKLLLKIGLMHQLLNRYQLARRYYVRAEYIAKRLDMSHQQSVATYQIGRIDEELGLYGRALISYRKSLRLDMRNGDRKGVAITYHQIAMIYQMHQHRYTHALKYFKKSIQLKKQLGNLEGIVNTLHQIATLEFQRKNYKRALRVYDQAEQLAKSLGYAQGLGRILHQKGMLYQAEGRHTQALKNYRASMKIKRKMEDARGAARNLHQIAVVYTETGQFSRARKMLDESISIKASVGDNFGLAQDYHQLALVLRGMGRTTDAVSVAKQSRRLYKKIKYKIGVNQIDQFLGR